MMSALEKLIAQKCEDEPESFPKGADYKTKYVNIDQYLMGEVHPEVQAGSVLHDGTSGYLTDHGPEHIKTVLAKASELIMDHNGETFLTPYEVFILAAAIQFHDVGNIFGRERHEQRASEAMVEAKKRASLESTEWRSILNIARAHGGRTQNGDKDTIRELPQEDHLHGHTIRPRMIAAILRFADELAEEPQRASRFLDDKGLIPEGSQIFHAYAGCVASIMVDAQGSAVMLKFEVKKANAVKTFGKIDEQQYLVDEIYERTLKTHLECVYCMRFLRPHIDISSIKVSIEVVCDDGLNVIDKIDYKLEESGYPETPPRGIHGICSELSGKTAEDVKDKIEESIKKAPKKGEAA